MKRPIKNLFTDRGKAALKARTEWAVANRLFEPVCVSAWDGEKSTDHYSDARVVIVEIEGVFPRISNLDLEPFAKIVSASHHPNRLFVYGEDRGLCEFVSETLSKEIMRIQCTAIGVEPVISCTEDTSFPDFSEMKTIMDNAPEIYTLIYSHLPKKPFKK